MGFLFLAGDFHTMHENEAVDTHRHTHKFMSIVSTVDAYGLIMSKRPPVSASKC
jgi:hypothetical protein